MRKLNDKIVGKSVLFISTKNKDYIRNQQEIRLLRNNAKSYNEIVFSDKSYLKRILRVYAACLKGIWKKADVIYVGFAPQLLVPFLKRWVKEKYVIVDFFISLFDTFVCDRKYFKEKSWIAKVLHKIDELTLDSCHYIIVDTQADRDYFSKEFHIPLHKLEVMYLEADSSIYDIHKYEQKRMLVLYFGSILPLQGVDVVLEAAGILKTHRDISFIIIGPFKKKMLNEKCYPNVVFYRWLPQEKLAEQIAIADLCIAGHFSKEIAKAKRTIPGKAYIYEAMKKPMILGDNEANHELFQEDLMHYYVEMGNAGALAEKIVEVKNRWGKCYEKNIMV